MLHCRVPNPSTATVYVFDLDGVMYLGDTRHPPCRRSRHPACAQAGKQVFFLTNNSGRTRADYREKAGPRQRPGHPRNGQIFTSAYATALYLKAPGRGGQIRVHHRRAGPGRRSWPQSGGLIPVTAARLRRRSHDIDYVVVGIDRQFTYDKLRFAHAAITRGHAQFIATNRDATFPMETGEIPGGGSLVAALATATGREPLTIGKPETHAYEAILQAAGVTAAGKRHDRRPPGHRHRRRPPRRARRRFWS